MAEKGTKQERTDETNNKIDLNLMISITSLNANSLHTPVKEQRLSD